MRNTMGTVCVTVAMLASAPAIAQQVTFPLQPNDSVEDLGRAGIHNLFAEKKWLSSAPGHATFVVLYGGLPSELLKLEFFETNCDFGQYRSIATSQGESQDEVRSNYVYTNNPWSPIGSALNKQTPIQLKARAVCDEVQLFSGPY